MSYSYSGTDNFDASATLLDDGDQVNKTSLMVGIIQKLFNRTTYTQNRINALAAQAWTWTAAHVFQAAITLSGNNALVAWRHSTANFTDANVSVNLTLADIFRVPSTLTGNRTYTINVTPTPPTGYRARVYRTKSASAHTVAFVEQTSGRALGDWLASLPAWADFIWDGTKWNMIGWDASSTNGATGNTSDP